MRNFRLVFTIIMITAALSAFYGCKRTINPALTDQFVKASYDGDIEKVKKLYDEGADINAESKANYDNTAFITAANSGKIEIVEFLLKKGVDVNQKNSSGYNALGSAMTGGRIDVIKLLIAKGADVNDPAGYGKTPLQRVEQWRKDYPNSTTWPQVIEILKNAGAK